MQRKFISNGEKYFSEISAIKSGKVADIYFLYGDDTYLHDFFVNTLEDKINQTTSVERIACYGDDRDLDRKLISELGSSSLFSQKKLILFRALNKLKPKQQEYLLEIIKHPNSDHTLIFQTYEKVNTRTKFWNTMKEKTNNINVNSFNPSDCSRWLKQFLKMEYKSSIDSHAETLFWKLTGFSLANAASEMEKIMLFFDEPKQITTDIIQSMVQNKLSSNMEELKISVGNGNRNDIICALENLFSQGIKGSEILWSMHQLLISIFLIREMISQGISNPQSVRTRARIWYGDVKMYILFSKRFNNKTIHKALSILISTEKKLKTISVNEKELVFSSLIRIVNP